MIFSKSVFLKFVYFSKISELNKKFFNSKLFSNNTSISLIIFSNLFPCFKIIKKNFNSLIKSFSLKISLNSENFIS